MLDRLYVGEKNAQQTCAACLLCCPNFKIKKDVFSLLFSVEVLLLLLFCFLLVE